MRALVILGLFLTIPVARGTFQPTRDVDFWRDTGFDRQQVALFISHSNCAQMKEACREAFLTAGYALHTHEFDVEDGRSEDRLLDRVEELTAAPAQNGRRAMIYGAMVNTILRQYDAHAMLAPAALLDTFGQASSRDVLGIGIEEEVNDAGIFIRRIYPHSAAEAAKLQVNDQILSIQGDRVRSGIKAFKSLRYLIQPKSALDLVIARGNRTLNVRVEVAYLSLNDVQTTVTAQDEAILTVRNFYHGVCRGVVRKISALNRIHPLRGVVLDLRFNPGGLLDEAACVMSLFTSNPEFVTKEPTSSEIPKVLPLELKFSQKDQDNWKDGLGPVVWPTLKLVVVVNASSASAAEMLAAALQDQQRAWVVGEITFGKGTTQGVAGQSFNPQVRLVYTVSRYYRPNKQPLHLLGMTPDFLTPFQAQAGVSERTFPREGEVYGTHLLPNASEAWTQPRLKDFTPLANCVDHRRNTNAADFQIETALTVLRCER